ncbi:MAG: hypothetical protein E7549_00480 [Ruminococcaceae bacterium]|nr:hypothetical protein [Oscillospiraceae bacterium]
MLQLDKLLEALQCCTNDFAQCDAYDRCEECPAREAPNCYEEIKRQAAETIERLFEAAHQLWTMSDVAMPDRELAEYSARHPEEGGVVEVLVMVHGATEPTVLLYDGDVFMDANGDRYKVDYWQPMPLPPKVVTG